MNRVYRLVYLCLVVAVLTAAVSFLLSYILGVLRLSGRFPGSDEYGAMIYYSWVAALVICFTPALFLKKIREMTYVESLLASVGTGLVFSLLSIWIHRLYLELIDDGSDGQPGELLAGYSYEETGLVTLGVWLAIVMLILRGFGLMPQRDTK